MYRDYALEIHYLTRRIEFLNKLNQVIVHNSSLFPDIMKEQIEPLLTQYTDVCSVDALLATLKPDDDQ